MSTITIKCNSCNKVFDVDLSEYDIEWEVVETHLREMGIEKNHEAIISGIECDGCKKSINVTINFWEYPEGSFIEPIITIDGGELVESDDLSELYSFDDKDIDDVEDDE